MASSYKTAISFNNKLIHVKMVKASKDNSIEFNQLCKDSRERVRYHKYCPNCDKEVTTDNIIKGYKISENRYVEITNDDLQSIKTPQDDLLTIQYFCNIKSIHPLYIDKNYYLQPELESLKDYKIFHQAMLSKGMCAICEIVIGVKQELVAIIPYYDYMIAAILFYDYEIKEYPHIGSPMISYNDLEIAEKFIDKNNKKYFDFEIHYDKYQEKLKKLIVQKANEQK